MAPKRKRAASFTIFEDETATNGANEQEVAEYSESMILFCYNVLSKLEIPKDSRLENDIKLVIEKLSELHWPVLETEARTIAEDLQAIVRETTPAYLQKRAQLEREEQEEREQAKMQHTK